jgi:glycosyltransferase involved in cell wall biosynthesis
LRHEQPPGFALPFTRPNISVQRQREVGGDTVAAKIGLVLAVPALALDLARTMYGADAVHVRCPGNLGLLGVCLAPLLCRHLVAKYAGQWNGYTGEPATVRLQRALLRSSWWRGPVTVYGRWPGQPAHVVPFFTSMMTARQVERAVAAAGVKRTHTPLRVLYAGVLTARKRVSVLLDAVKVAVDRGVPLRLTILGSGPDEGSLRQLAERLGIADVTDFVGAIPFDAALDWYEWADCLVLPSRHSEGWPKVVAEAMTHGVVAIAVAHGHVPTMLQGRGIVLESGTADEIAVALQSVADRPEEYRALAHAASSWASQYSLEGLRDALAELLSDRWHLPRAHTSPPVPAGRIADLSL